MGTYNVVSCDLVDLAPSIHDPSIVVGDDSNKVNSLGLKLAEFLDVRGQVVRLATRSEGAGNADNNNLLSLPFLGCIIFLRTAALGGVGVGNGNPSGHD